MRHRYFVLTPHGVIKIKSLSYIKKNLPCRASLGSVADGVGELHLLPPYNQAEAVRSLTEFSHIWLLFVFHQTPEGGWRLSVRLPRLGGNSRMGVSATRSPFCLNPIGMSLVALEGITLCGADVILRLGSLNLVDGTTPVVDIKPYLPYAESLPDARAGFAQAAHADIAKRLNFDYTMWSESVKYLYK